MSNNQTRILISASFGVPFERQVALGNLNSKEILNHLDYKKTFELLDKNIPSDEEMILPKLSEYNFFINEDDKWHITNLGAILFANDLNDFNNLFGKTIVARKYIGTSNFDLQAELIKKSGYAVGIDRLMDFIFTHTQIGERKDIRREYTYQYPPRAIRELLVNAMIHQDFTILGMKTSIEIFSDRIVFTNAGAPLIDINRFIDTTPTSRNEILSNFMYLLKFCEKRGSGIDYVIEAIEKAGLPPVEFTRSEQYTKVILFPKKPLSQMTTNEKIMACYQHACLLYEQRKTINNQSVRERFSIDQRNSAIASRILNDTYEAGKIKKVDPENDSRRYATYIPHYG